MNSSTHQNILTYISITTIKIQIVGIVNTLLDYGILLTKKLFGRQILLYNMTDL